jgi:pimeloyl-ACP methyl ester carboxylesterase
VSLATFQDGEHAVEPGTADRSVPVPDPVPGRRQPAPGEADGRVLLPSREHVHHERAVPADGVELAEIPHSGHWPMYADPVAMWERLAAFVHRAELTSVRG